jgi:hypothetical protein
VFIPVLVQFALLTGGDLSLNRGKIEGTRWSSLAATLTIKGQKQSIPAGALTLAFTRDGKLTYVAGPLTMTGTYALKPGDKVVLKLDRELDGKKEHTESVVIRDDRLTMTDSDGTALTFEKVKK